MRSALIFLWLVASSCTVAQAQETVVLGITGWNQDERDGVAYFRCAGSVCAEGSVVSYKRQPHRPTLTLADFERHQQRLAASNRGTANIRGVRLTSFRERMVEGVRIYSVLREVEWADGSATFTVSSLLTGPAHSYTVISDARRPDWATRNFDGFLPRLIDIALLRAP